MLLAQKQAQPEKKLTQEEVRLVLQNGSADQFKGKRVLVLIPDHTRTLPLPFLFRELVDILKDTRQLDFMVALGTHPKLDEQSLCKLVGISIEERKTTYEKIGLLNHAWNEPEALKKIGEISKEEVQQIAGDLWHPSLGGDVDVRINKSVFDYDHILILGPTFPHEVAGFSGGDKYLFPGISGPEMINVTHWLGALKGVVGTIGIADTPVRTMIHTAAKKLTVPLTLIALVAVGYDIAGMFIGDHIEAWRAAAGLSAQRHIQWKNEAYDQVLSCAPPMYDELWTAAKAMYKLEPVVKVGGEVIVYAPSLDTVSHVHGKYIYQVGYHILDYFLADWPRFKDIPLGVLAHSTHFRGSGAMVNGVEKPNVRVTLASKIPEEDCARLNLGYLDPAKVDVEKWQGQEDKGLLYVPKAGEILYRLKGSE
ncbi:MAG: DUF2088 domain-containing protein [Anaerolineaceae bacterium]|nr:DUF2088 domain-containing protein [Anaerolineaceae bacterium]